MCDGVRQRQQWYGKAAARRLLRHRGRGRLMVAASSNGGGDGRKQGGGGKERRNNQIEAMAAAGVICVQRRRWMMAFEIVGNVQWRSTETAMVRQGGSKTTARIELKSRWPTAESDGGCQTAVLAVVNIAAVVLCPLSTMLFLTVAALSHHPTTVVVAVVSSSVFLRRRRAAVGLLIPTAMTTRTMTTAPARIT